MHYDYDASTKKLSDKMREMRNSNWNPTPRVKELRKFAGELEKAADLMSEYRWMSVEESYEQDPKPVTGVDGYPIPFDENESKKGFYQSLKWQLRDIAEVARQEAESFPSPQSRPVMPYGALVFLHIWYQCENDRPTLYDESEAVIAFSKVCEVAGIYLSPPRIRTLLGKALENFDGASWPPGLDRILVYSQ